MLRRMARMSLRGRAHGTSPGSSGPALTRWGSFGATGGELDEIEEMVRQDGENQAKLTMQLAEMGLKMYAMLTRPREWFGDAEWRSEYVEQMREPMAQYSRVNERLLDGCEARSAPSWSCHCLLRLLLGRRCHGLPPRPPPTGTHGFGAWLLYAHSGGAPRPLSTPALRPPASPQPHAPAKAAPALQAAPVSPHPGRLPGRGRGVLRRRAQLRGPRRERRDGTAARRAAAGRRHRG